MKMHLEIIACSLEKKILFSMSYFSSSSYHNSPMLDTLTSLRASWDPDPYIYGFLFYACRCSKKDHKRDGVVVLWHPNPGRCLKTDPLMPLKKKKKRNKVPRKHRVITVAP